MHFHTSLLLDKGGREVNQDVVDFRIFPWGGIWALGDGLGGYHGGEMAARLAVDTVISHYRKQDPFSSLKVGLEEAQEKIRREQQLSTLRRSMRTTIALLAIKGEEAYFAHIGDSRLYHFRGAKLISQTKDHSVCQALVNAGEIHLHDIRFHEDRNRLYRVLGTDGNVKATISEGIRIESGDAFLLCSDGFWEYVEEEEMENNRLRASSPGEWLESMEAIMKKKVSEGHDNYSAVAVFVKDHQG